MLPYNIVVSFPNAIRLDSMFIMESISRNNVTSFTIQASNDNINWTSMFTGSTIGESGIEFEVSSISFIYWKLSIVDVENQGNKCVDIKYWNILHEASKIYNAMSSFDEIIPQHSLHLNLLDVFSYIKADFTLIDDNRFKPEYLSINGWVLLNNSAVDILCMTESTTETNIRTSVYWTKLNHINLSFNKNTNTCPSDRWTKEAPPKWFLSSDQLKVRPKGARRKRPAVSFSLLHLFQVDQRRAQTSSMVHQA